jgi:phage terminase small subunit
LAVEVAQVAEDTPLTPRQRAFVEEYLTDLNGSQAAIRAGYSPTSAHVIATENIRKPNIAAAIARGQAARANRVGITKETVLQEMAVLAMSSLDHYQIDDQGNVKPAEGAPDGVMRAIQSIKRSVTVAKDGSKTYHAEVRLWMKAEPLKLMGRHVGLFADRVEHTGKDGGPIEQVTEIRRTIVRPNGKAGE